jgi:hypothetical protein
MNAQLSNGPNLANAETHDEVLRRSLEVAYRQVGGLKPALSVD